MKIKFPSFELKEPNLASMSEQDCEDFSIVCKERMKELIKQDDEEFLRYLNKLKNL